MTEQQAWQTMAEGAARTWRLFSQGRWWHTCKAQSGDRALAEFVADTVEHLREYGYPESFDFQAVCLETGERAYASGTLYG